MYKNLCVESLSYNNINKKFIMSGCITVPKEKENGFLFTFNRIIKNEDLIFTKVNKVAPEETYSRLKLNPTRRYS